MLLQQQQRAALCRCAAASSSVSPLPAAAAAPWSRHRAVAAAASAAAAPAAAASATDAVELKRRVVELSGGKYGHNLSPEQRTAVVDTVQQLVALKRPVKVTAEGLAGSVWTTVFTTSDGPSSGKVGPFITDVTQEFPAAAPGTYANISSLGLVAARLEGAFRATRPDRIDLEFKTLCLTVLGFTLASKAFERGAMRGHWALLYADDDFRCFETNKGNLFVLRRLEGKTA